MCAAEITIRINGVSYVRDPEKPGDILQLLFVKGYDPFIAADVAKKAPEMIPGQKYKFSGIDVSLER